MEEKKEYKVYLNEYIDRGDGEIKDHVVGEYKTYAVSSKKAINNIQWRLKLNQYNCIKELPGDGVRKLYFTAKEVTNENKKNEVKLFKDTIYLKCGYCGYNNERKRLEFYKRCLNCNRPLGDKKVFQETLKLEMEKLK